MTTRLEQSFPILNGPHGGDRVTGPAGTLPGSAMCLAFDGPRGLEFAVYVLVEASIAGAAGKAAQPGLAYLRSWPTAREAQAHAHDISTAVSVAREVAKSN